MRISTILRSLAALREPIRVSGANASANAWLLRAWANDLKPAPGSGRIPPIIAVCEDDEVAARLVDDLEGLNALSAAPTGATDGGGALPLRVYRLPGWEQSLFSSIAPSIRVRLERIAALAAVASTTHGESEGNAERTIIVTTLPASAQATLPPALLGRFTRKLRIGQSIGSRDRFTLELLHAGYQRVDPVEDPGTFAVRGEIIDVFPPGCDRPLRIELFDDVIEKIRAFDPATQRTDAAAGISALEICPAREVLINPDTVAGLRERLKQRADDLGIPRAVRDPIMHSVADGVYPDHHDAWAPFAYAEPATFWDHVAPEVPVAFVDELSSSHAWDEFFANQAKHAADASERGLILPELSALFRFGPPLERDLAARTRLYLDRIELTDAATLEPEGTPQNPNAARDAETDAEPIGPKHRLSIRDNRDLETGGRHGLGELEGRFAMWVTQGYRVFVFAATETQVERIRFMLGERGIVGVSIQVGQISGGFRWPAERLAILSEAEVLGAQHTRKQRKARGTASGGGKSSAAKDWAGLQALSDLAIGDAVVHVDHGIGRYRGLIRMDVANVPGDFLALEYAAGDKLYLPVYRLNVIQKYAGAGPGTGDAILDRLGSQQFAKEKERVRGAVQKLAVDLIKLYAERKVRPGVAMSGRDTAFREFEATFPFDETADQLKAIDDVLEDLQSGRVMDRLVCGDVGYGKTEVAIRAAFRAVSDGYQVAVLVPTTVLAHQHEQSFRARLKDYPLNVESVSRFKSAKEQKAVLEGVKSGKVDIVIGTHRLLSKDVTFNSLGLIIVDEEHRFGVDHKEKLKTLKVNTHVLTLTATPIPRTLHMALSGLRDISLINTPPVDRLPIRTYVSKLDDQLVQKAIEVELNRGGQVFYVHNRVQTIFETANRVRELVPGARIVVGHGQMGEGELEAAMLKFYRKEADVLVCTTIIESGLDLPSANTILIDRADAMGLAQLYQIRGRVGRGQARGYAYLFIPGEGTITEDAKRRLEVLQRFVELGSGFSIASHDLEIRGGGDVLGPQQSGHIAAVGFDLYTELLEEAIRALQGQPLEPADQKEPEIKAPFPAFLPDAYVPDVHQRLSLYRRFSAARSEGELVGLEEELADRFGALPIEARNLVWLIRIKQSLKRAGVEVLTVGPEKASLQPGPRSLVDPVKAIALMSAKPKIYQLTPDSRFVARLPTDNLRDLHFGLEKLLHELGVPA